MERRHRGNKRRRKYPDVLILRIGHFKSPRPPTMIHCANPRKDTVPESIKKARHDGTPAGIIGTLPLENREHIYRHSVPIVSCYDGYVDQLSESQAPGALARKRPTSVWVQYSAHSTSFHRRCTENTIYIWSPYSSYQASSAFLVPLFGIYTKRGTLSGPRIGANIPKQGSEMSALLYLDCNRDVTRVTFRPFARG